MEVDEKKADVSEHPFKSLKERAYNALVMGRIDTEYLFLAYYNRYGNFLGLRQCGAKTNEELVNLAKELIAKKEAKEALHEDESQAKPGTSAQQTESEEKAFVLNAEGINAFHQVPQRLKNILHVNGLFTAEQFVRFYRQYGEFIQLRHCGKLNNALLIEHAEKLLKNHNLHS